MIYCALVDGPGLNLFFDGVGGKGPTSLLQNTLIWDLLCVV